VYLAGEKKAETLALQGFQLFLEVSIFVALKRNKCLRQAAWNADSRPPEFPENAERNGSQLFDA